MPHRNLLLIFATLILSYACYVRAEQNPYARYVAAGYSFIDQRALQEPGDQQLFEGAMRGMIDVLRRAGDDYSAFVSEKNHDEFREGLTQQFGGVGVRIRLLGKPTIPTVIGPPKAKSPAAEAQLRSGDQILSIDGQTTADMAMEDVLRLMRGPVGKPIQLAIRPLVEDQPGADQPGADQPGAAQPSENSTRDVQLNRAIITMESVWGDVRDENNNWQFRLRNDPRIGYLRITTFGDMTVGELTRALAELTSSGDQPPIEALILDVRDNPGGPLDAAVDISDLFLRAGKTIVTTRRRDEEVRDRFVSTGEGNYTQLPMAILINQNSASASEIVAACLQDYGRAAIVGQRSYGKGTVQRLMRIESGRSLLKLTSATYWRPSEQNIHRMPTDAENDTWGVQPNPGLEVTLDADAYVEWRKYRDRRDLLGDQPTGTLAEQLNEADGALPPDYEDRALQRAIDHLQAELTEVGETFSL